eukprot:jgi/Mesvir1/18897/Mv18894-RA.1
MSKRGSSQYKGVTWDEAKKKWMARVQIDGKYRTLGRFINEEDAVRAVDAAILARDGAAAITNLSFLRDGVADEAIIIKSMQRQSAAVAALAGDSDDADVDTPAMEEGRGMMFSSRCRGKRRGVDASTAEPSPALVAPEKSGARRPSKRGARPMGNEKKDPELQALPLAIPAEDAARLLPGRSGPAEGASCERVAPHQQDGAPAESDDDADGCPPLLQLSASSDDDDARGDHANSRGSSDSEPDSDSDEEQGWPQAAIDEFEKMYGTRDYQAATARMRQQLWGVPRNDICLIRQVDPK